MTLIGLEPLAYVALGAGAVLAYRPLVNALMRWRWLTGDDPHPAVGQTRSHVRVVRDEGFAAVPPAPNATADVSHMGWPRVKPPKYLAIQPRKDRAPNGT